MKKVLFLFGELSDPDIDWLIAHGKKTSVAQGTVLIHKGEQIDALFIVLEGLLDVSVPGHDKLISRLGAGEIVGELSFVDSRTPSTTVRAATDSVVYSVAREVLSARLQEEAEFAARFYRALSIFLAHRMRRLTLQMSAGPASSSERPSSDELNEEVLDGVYLAGSRFQRMLKGVSSGPSNVRP